MPGFRVPSKTIRINLNDPDYAGAEIYVRTGITLEQLMEITSRMEANSSEEAFSAMKDFGDFILESWNIYDMDDNPIPANGAGLIKVDFNFAKCVLESWVESVTAVDTPLESRSTNGKQSEEPTTTTAEESLDLESLSRPN